MNRRWATTMGASALIGVFAVGGCGGPAGTDGASSSSSEPTTSSARLSDEPDACADGNCEITVSKPVTVRFKGPDGPVTLTVNKVGPNEADYMLKGGNGLAQGGASGERSGCVTVLRSNGSSTSCGRASDTGPSAEPGTVAIQLATGEDGTATLRIASD
ncbi:hypothetical protein [Streptomyces sp. NPDC046821]|uniref:hypothetical protein n=1 Tax=Streptomyces sp. NPDC046821 TaxID=3154702 RepID=UPI0033FC43EB